MKRCAGEFSDEVSGVAAVQSLGAAAEAARRAAVYNAITEACAEGRSLVVEVDEEVRRVPASKLLTIVKREAADAGAATKTAAERGGDGG